MNIFLRECVILLLLFERNEVLRWRGCYRSWINSTNLTSSCSHPLRDLITFLCCCRSGEWGEEEARARTCGRGGLATRLQFQWNVFMGIAFPFLDRWMSGVSLGVFFLGTFIGFQRKTQDIGMDLQSLCWIAVHHPQTSLRFYFT